MGIDPVTHKPLSQVEAASQPPKPHNKKPQDQEHKSIQDSNSSEEDLDQVVVVSRMNQGFCIDEVPPINPSEILDMPSKFMEDMECLDQFLDQFLDLEWIMSEDSGDKGDNNMNDKREKIVDDMDLWDNDLSSLDLLMSDDFAGSEGSRSLTYELL